MGPNKGSDFAVGGREGEGGGGKGREGEGG